MNDLEKTNKSISQSEAKILTVLWKNQPLNGKQIAQHLIAESWSFVTTKTLINRLLTKGYLSFEKQGRQYFYSATISEKKYLKTENKNFVKRMYSGSFSGLFAAFTEHENISKKELAEIKLMIKEMEKEQ